MKRNLYLKTVSVEEALDRYLTRLKEEGIGFMVEKSENAGNAKSKNEDSKIEKSEIEMSKFEIESSEIKKSEIEMSKLENEIVHAATAEPVFAKCCSPLFNASAMDGVAVKAEDTKFASEQNPVRLKLGKDYRIVDTGDPIHAPYDAVIMAEDVVEIDDETIEINQSVPGWNMVRPIGEDIVVGEMIIPSNHKIRPVDVGVMLASGNTTVKIKYDNGITNVISTYDCIQKKGNSGVKVGIIPTGTEIIRPYDEPKEGDIIDSNSGMFAAQVAELGAIPKRYDIVADDYEKIKDAVLQALDENDMVITNAGSSAGTEDYTVHILRELGEVVIHGVAMKPGKPVILAIVNGKPVIGLPGYPVSAYLAFENFVAPVIDMLNQSGEKSEDVSEIIDRTTENASKASELTNNTTKKIKKSNEITAVVSKRIVSSLKHREYVRVKVGKVDDRYICAPLSRGASAAMSLVRADGFLVIPQNSEGYDAGEEVRVDLYNSLEQIDNTLVSIGSHDMLMDIVNDMMSIKYLGLTLSSTHVGSMGGLMALSRGETIIAPTHLLDEEDGKYNVSYLKKIFGSDISLIKGVDRIQGIMVKAGNPLNIKSVSDIQKTGARFVNRQRGAGTRVLLDYIMKKEGITPDDINGYDKEVATHMAVAASVKGDEIDCGMGIKPAADAMGLDFVVIGPEEYDFAIKTKDLENPKVKAFIDIIKSDEFKEKLTEIGGYGFSHTGEIINL